MLESARSLLVRFHEKYERQENRNSYTMVLTLVSLDDRGSNGVYLHYHHWIGVWVITSYSFLLVMIIVKDLSLHLYRSYDITSLKVIHYHCKTVCSNPVNLKCGRTPLIWFEMIINGNLIQKIIILDVGVPLFISS